MFLAWPESLGLLQSRDDTNIMSPFPYPVRRTVVAAVVERLESFNPQISTPAHVKWLMEVIAQGFTLNMEDLPVIERCVTIYTKWLLGGPEDKPPGLLAEETFFRGEMLGHLSFLFEPRTGTVDTNQLTVQTRLCKDVLDNIILAAAHKLRGVLTPAIWDIWIRLLIGIVDSIFMNKSKSSPAVHAVLCKSLSAPAFRVLLEVLFLSQNRDPAIWNSIVTLAVNWIRTPVVSHWCSAVNALTLRVLALMYGPKFGGACGQNLMIEWIAEDKGSVKSTLTALEHDFIFFAWRRFVALLPEPQTITEPEVFRTFFQGVSVMVNHYSKVMDQGPHCPKASKQKLPDGNSILALVGRWLFNALLTDRPSFEDGTSIAARITCQLFCRTPATTSEPAFQREYLAAFYAALARILTKTHTDSVLRTVLNSTKSIFLREYPGSELLIPSFLYAGAALWREQSTDAHVRTSFIELLSSLVCYTDNLTDTKIVSKLSFEIAYGTSQQRVAPVIAQFTTLRQHFQVLFSTALTKEDTPRNIVRLISLIVAFLHDYSKNAASGPERETYILFASSTINEIVRKSRDMWPHDVVTHAYASLSNIAHLMSSLGHNANLVAKLVLGSISEHVSMLTGNPSRDAAEKDIQDKTIYRALLTLTDWWMTDPNLPSIMDSKTVQSVTKAIVSCLGLPGKPYTSPPMVKAAADYALHHLMTSSSFPNSIGPQRVSSEISEDDIVATILNVDSKDPLVSQHCRYFILDEHIIMCLIDVPRPLPEPNLKQEPQLCDVYVVLRDSTGRFVWKTNPSFYEREEALNPPYDNLSSEKVTKEPVIKNRYELGIQQELYTDLVGYLNSLRADRLYAGSLISHSQTYVETEKAHLERSSYGLDVDMKYKLPEFKSPYDSTLRFHAGRVLLSNLGFAHPETYGRLVPLDSRPGFGTALKQLDSSTERSVMSIGVVLMQQAPKKPYDFLVDEAAGPQDYQDFLTSIGWGINLWDHTGYRGPLSAASTGDYAPYYADFSTEVIFPVANWIPNTDSFETTLAKKRKVLAACPVLIVWSLSGEYEAPVSQREYLHIVIHPLQSGLYRIRLVTRENRPLLAGPLTDNMKLSRRVLGPMVRMTAIAATRFLQPESAILAPCSIRKSRIEEIAKAYQRPIAFDDWMTNIMSVRMPPDLTAPAHVHTTATTAASPAISAFANAMPMRLTMEGVDGYSNTGASTSPPMQHSHSFPVQHTTPHGRPLTMTMPVGVNPGGGHTGHGGHPIVTTPTVSAPSQTAPTITSSQPVLTRTLSSTMPVAAPPTAPSNAGSGNSPRSQSNAATTHHHALGASTGLAIPSAHGSGGVHRTSAPSSPRGGDHLDSASADDTRNRQHSISSSSESGDLTPGRSPQLGSRQASSNSISMTHSHSGELDHSSGSASGGVNPTPGGLHSPAPGSNRYSTHGMPSAPGAMAGAYKMPARTPPPAYNPTAVNTSGGSVAPSTPTSGGPPPMPVLPSTPTQQPTHQHQTSTGGSPTGGSGTQQQTSQTANSGATAGSNTPSSSAGAASPATTSNNQANSGGSYTAMGSSQPAAAGNTSRKPSVAFPSFWKKDKDKDKKPEDKTKDPKKK